MSEMIDDFIALTSAQLDAALGNTEKAIAISKQQQDQAERITDDLKWAVSLAERLAAENDELKAEIARLKARNAELEAQEDAQ